jgi:S-adenosylmethionine decarboxylase
MNVGQEWIVDATGCAPDALRDLSRLRALLERVIADLSLKPVGEPMWHKFPGEGGVTGLVLLSESHLACHTYPEFGVATFNLYCCRERPDWSWRNELCAELGASEVHVRTVRRATFAPRIDKVVAEG